MIIERSGNGDWRDSGSAAGYYAAACFFRI